MIYLLIGLAAILLVWWWWKEDPTEPPEMPGKLPFVGHGLMVLGDSVDMFNSIKTMSSEAELMGGVVKIHLGPRKFYAVVDPEDCNTVLTECLNKLYIYDFFKPLTANGLLNADVPTWRVNRRLLNPAFSQQVLDGFIDIFNTRAASLVKAMEKEVGKLFDQETYLRINNLETICETSLGIEVEDFASLQKNYLPHLEEVLHITNSRIQKFWFHSDFIFNLSSPRKKLDEALRYLHHFTDKVLEKKKVDLANAVAEDKPGKMKPFINLISDLAKEHPALTEWQVRGETNTVIVGGHDTSASALTFALCLVGSKPEVQERAYREILEVLGDSNRSINKDDLSQLVYIEAILKESLRLYPSVPVVARQLDKDIKLKNCTLKSGNGCIVSIYGSSRHAIWGADANEFRPERWFEKDTLPPSKYITAFGLGRRSCIGKTYAMMAMKISLAYVIRTYLVYSDASEIVPKMEIMIRPERGYYITLKQRQ